MKPGELIDAILDRISSRSRDFGRLRRRPISLDKIFFRSEGMILEFAGSGQSIDHAIDFTQLNSIALTTDSLAETIVARVLHEIE